MNGSYIFCHRAIPQVPLYNKPPRLLYALMRRFGHILSNRIIGTLESTIN
jgi:hypothetical protein